MKMYRGDGNVEGGQDDGLGEGSSSAFEARMRQRSLGEKAAQPGQILYRCGYEAGFAVARKRWGRTAATWRGMSLVASVLACLAMATSWFGMGGGKLASREEWRDDGSLKVRPVERLERESGSDSEDWVASLVGSRPKALVTAGAIRASTASRLLDQMDETRFDGVPLETDEQGLKMRSKTIKPWWNEGV